MNIVYFDLETRRSAAEVGGWHNTAKMGISVAVTYSSATEKYTIYQEHECEALIEELRQADLVIGYNHLHFDYGVLQPHSMWNMADITVNLDLCRELEHLAGYRPKLDSVAQASLGMTKIAVGTDALKWWAQYQKTKDSQKFIDIARYCCFDVKVTKEVYLYGVKHGYVLCTDKQGEIQQIAVPWKSV